MLTKISSKLYAIANYLNKITGKYQGFPRIQRSEIALYVNILKKHRDTIIKYGQVYGHVHTEELDDAIKNPQRGTTHDYYLSRSPGYEKGNVEDIFSAVTEKFHSRMVHFINEEFPAIIDILEKKKFDTSVFDKYFEKLPTTPKEMKELLDHIPAVKQTKWHKEIDVEDYKKINNFLNDLPDEAHFKFNLNK